MNGETQDGPETSSRGAGWGWVLWPGTVLLLYVLGSGPVMMMKEEKLIPYGDPGSRAAEIVYWPVDWAFWETPLRKPIGMYWRLWAPEWCDAQENIKVFK